MTDSNNSIDQIQPTESGAAIPRGCETKSPKTKIALLSLGFFSLDFLFHRRRDSFGGIFIERREGPNCNPP